MPSVGSEQTPLRVAIIGAGPAAFYTAAHLQKETDLHVKIDMFDLLPSPFGLVRTGVAPDHQKYKTVQRVYDKTARHPGFRFFGNVSFGEQIHLDDLKHFFISNNYYFCQIGQLFHRDMFFFDFVHT